jgi:hypothetical protein
MQTKNRRFVDDLSTNFHCRCFVWYIQVCCCGWKDQKGIFSPAFKIKKKFENIKSTRNNFIGKTNVKISRPILVFIVLQFVFKNHAAI